MAIMRRLYKASTAKMLSLPCFPSLADLIVLSGFLSLESPSSLYITYSYGYHQKSWQNQHCKNAYLVVSSLSLSGWFDSIELIPSVGNPIIFLFTWALDKTRTDKMLTMLCLPSVTGLIALSGCLSLETLPSLYMLPFNMVIIRKFAKTSAQRCEKYLPRGVFFRWLLYRIEWIPSIDNSTFHITYSYDSH